MDLATPNDRWNIRFAWLAYFGSHATFLALVVALACRASLWLPSKVGGQDPVALSSAPFGAAIPIACLGIAAVFIPDALVPCAASLFRGYALVLSSFSGDEVGEGLVGVNVKIVAAALGGAGALLVLGWRIKKRRPMRCYRPGRPAGGTPCALSLTLAGREQWVYQAEGFQSLLFFERAVNLGSGVSPFVPVILLTAIVIFWAWSQLRRITYAERFWGPPLAVRADADDSGPLIGTSAGPSRQILPTDRRRVVRQIPPRKARGQLQE